MSLFLLLLISRGFFFIFDMSISVSIVESKIDTTLHPNLFFVLHSFAVLTQPYDLLTLHELYR